MLKSQHHRSFHNLSSQNSHTSSSLLFKRLASNSVLSVNHYAPSGHVKDNIIDVLTKKLDQQELKKVHSQSISEYFGNRSNSLGYFDFKRMMSV